MIEHIEIKLTPRDRGFHLITSEIQDTLPSLPTSGLLNLFIKHTSAGITLNENCDPSVRSDFSMAVDRIVPERNFPYTHTAEGPDDMPAHIKSTFIGQTLTIPRIEGKLELGTWQGIYLGEFRNHASSRKLIASIYS
jgi:secondary thiamine-phosphate synthase enzyme